MLHILDTMINRSKSPPKKPKNDSFEVSPVKNIIQMKKCTEIYLAGREIHQLKQFDKFPNLQVLYLNDNSLKYIIGLDTNIRLKELYVHNNQLKNLHGSLAHLIYLEKLTLYNNQLRDLDKCLKILKCLEKLEILDLFGNFVSEEPNYRARVILAMPNLKVLDRHRITLTDRDNAQEIKDYDLHCITREHSSAKKYKSPIPKLSPIEKSIFTEASTIRKRQEQILREQAYYQEYTFKTRDPKFFDSKELPKPFGYQFLAKRKQDSTIGEWEKINLLPIFAKYDSTQAMVKSKLHYSDVPSFYNDLMQDKACIALVPGVSLEDFRVYLNLDPEVKPEISWNEFRQKASMIKWIKAEINATKTKIDELYKNVIFEYLIYPRLKKIYLQANRLQSI